MKRIALILFFFFCMLTNVYAENINIIYTGNTNGLSSSLSYRINTPYFLFLDYVKQKGRDVIKDFGITSASMYFFNNSTYVWGKNLGIKEFMELLEKKSLDNIKFVKEINILDAEDSITFETLNNDSVIEELKNFADRGKTLKVNTKKAYFYNLDNEIYMLKFAQSLNPSFNIESWELILGLGTQIKFNYSPKILSFITIAKPLGEGLRRINLIKSLKNGSKTISTPLLNNEFKNTNNSTNHALLIDSGNILEGLSSVFSGKLSLQRPNSVNSINYLNYFAIAVGENELRGGIDYLSQEQKKYNLPLICANLLIDKKPQFPAYKLVNTGKSLIGIIGISDPDMLENLKEINVIPSNSEIIKPIDAITKALTDIYIETGQKPNIVIVLTNAGNEYIDDICSYGKDVNIILTENTASYQEMNEIMEISDWHDQSAIVLHSNPYSINMISIDINDDKTKIINHILPIEFDLKPDEQFLPEVMKIRQSANMDALDILIPDVRDIIVNDPELLDIFINSQSTVDSIKYFIGTTDVSKDKIIELYPPRITREILDIIIANIIFKTFNNEVVIMKNKNNIPEIPGDLPKLIVYEMVKTDDLIEEYYITGKQLKELQETDSFVFAGITRDPLQVWGREPNDREIYKTIIPSSISNNEKVKKIIEKANKKTLFYVTLLNNKEKQEIYLRDLIIKYLESLKDKNYKSSLANLMKPQWDKKRNLFSIRVDDLRINLKGYDVYNNDSYSNARETRVVSPKSVNMSSKGKLSLMLENEDLNFINSMYGEYETSSVYDNNIPISNELKDDLVFSSELGLNFFELSMKQKTIKLIPYIELLYDTEFTPTLDKDNNVNPRQADLNGIFGINIAQGTNLKKFKLGAILKKDLNNPNNNIEAGLTLDLRHELPVWDKLKWINNLECKYYLPGPNDTDSDLGLITKWLCSFDISLTDNLYLNLFADSFIFQGKLPANSQIGASVILGVGLSYDRFWKPYYENMF